METPLAFIPGNQPDRPHGLQSITLKRADGSSLSLDPAVTRLNFSEEHPDVDRMGDDWGAICEVYKAFLDTYLSIPGIVLQAGDVLTLAYPDKPALNLRVIELEAGRARVSWIDFPGY